MSAVLSRSVFSVFNFAGSPLLFFGHGRHTATIAIAEIATTPKLAVAVFTPPLVFTALGVCRTEYVCQEVLSK